MREFTIEEKDAGKRLDRFAANAAPGLPGGLAQKFIRLKRIKINGKPAQMGDRLNLGDRVEMYIEDCFFETPRREDPLLSHFRHHVTRLYEDEHILLCDKRPGLIVHPDESEKVNTLLTHVRAYLYQNGRYDPAAKDAFSPVACNRIDRFTGGIVIMAKTREGMNAMNGKIRAREVDKYYLCVAHGQLKPDRGTFSNYLLKKPGHRRVQVFASSVPGAQLAQTQYETLCCENGLSLVKCRLITGRTHQIRAQMANAGHPLLGDGQYADARLNARYARAYQALYAYRIDFNFRGDAGVLSNLCGKSFTVRDVPFARDYFPDKKLDLHGV